MQITVNFTSFDEMINFAANLRDNKALIPAAPITAAPAAPVTTSVTPPMAALTTAAQVAPSVPTPASAPTPIPTPAPVPIPTTTKTYKLDDIARAAMPIMDAGRQEDLLQLLAQFGVDSLPALPQEQYGAFATALRGLGAQI